MMQIEAEDTEVTAAPVVETEDDASEVDSGAGSETLNEGQDDVAGDDDGEVVVSIGEVSPTSEEEEHKAAPDWVKELRKIDREKTRKIRELEEQLKAASPANKVEQALAKPTLESCDFDTDEYERKFDAWKAQQVSHAEKQRAKEAEEKAASDAWQAKLDAHGKAKASLKVPDYDDKEAEVAEAFSVTQRGIIVSGADNSALVIYALGSNPAKLKELASITDPTKFAFAVAKLETQLKVTPRKAPPAPEKRVSGSAPVSGSANSELVRLEAEAEKTGDRSKVIAYRREQRRAA
jgi:hypothetical protein